MQGFTLITGASSGLGRAVALRLPGPLLLQGRDPDRLASLLEQCPPGSESWARDLTADPLPIPPHRLQGIVHCAGSLRIQPTRLQSPADPEALFRVHLFSIQAILRGAELAPDCRVTLVSSAGARLGDAGNGLYTGAKAALEAFAACARSEGLDVRVFCPGLFLSPMGEQAIADPAVRTRLEGRYPLGLGSVEHAADLLATLHQRRLPLRILVADGGRLARAQGI